MRGFGVASVQRQKTESDYTVVSNGEILFYDALFCLEGLHDIDVMFCLVSLSPYVSVVQQVFMHDASHSLGDTCQHIQMTNSLK